MLTATDKRCRTKKGERRKVEGEVKKGRIDFCKSISDKKEKKVNFWSICWWLVICFPVKSSLTNVLCHVLKSRAWQGLSRANSMKIIVTCTAPLSCGFGSYRCFLPLSVCLFLSLSTSLWPSSAALLHTSLRFPLRSSSDTSRSVHMETHTHTHTPANTHELMHSHTGTCYGKADYKYSRL